MQHENTDLMKNLSENPIVNEAVQQHLLTGERVEVNFYVGKNFMSAVVSGNSLYLYNDQNELISTRPI